MQKNNKTIVVELNETQQRIDRYIKKIFSNATQGFVEKALRKKDVRVNGLISKASYKLVEGDIITFNDFFLSKVDLEPVKDNPHKATKEDEDWIENIIIFEDENMLVINKPIGISSQGGTGIKNSIDEILNRLYDNIHLVHRLDKQTSGVMVFAKNRLSAKHFCDQFKERTAMKTYETILDGLIYPGDGFINEPLLKKRAFGSEKMFVDKNGLSAKTEYKNIKKSRRNNLSYIEAFPKTGRTHQLRAHFAHKECPILGDEKYGDQENKTEFKLCLHAKSLTIRDIDNALYTFNAPLPEHMEDILDKYF